MGSKFKLVGNQSWFSGGSGYVLSRKAVQIFVEKGLKDLKKCPDTPTYAEDLEIGKCLDKFGVKAGDDSHIIINNSRF